MIGEKGNDRTMTMLLESTRPYQRLSNILKNDVDEALAGFRAYLDMLRPKTPSTPSVCVQKGNCAIAVAEPEPQNVTPEPEIDFLPQTQSQKRTRNPKVEKRTPLTRGESGDSAAAPFYDRTLKDRIVSFVTRQGPVTSADIGQHFGMERRRTSVLLADLQNKKRLSVVGYKKTTGTRRSRCYTRIRISLMSRPICRIHTPSSRTKGRRGFLRWLPWTAAAP